MGRHEARRWGWGEDLSGISDVSKVVTQPEAQRTQHRPSHSPSVHREGAGAYGRSPGCRTSSSGARSVALSSRGQVVK